MPPGGEATLDVEVLDAAAPGLKGIDVYETKPSASATLRALTSPLQNRGFKPQVISASLGLCEPDVFLAIGLKGLRSVEGSLAMAAGSGISFLASSGDQGSADCVDLTGAPVARLSVNYPSSSPWVTGVGGTNFALTPANTIAAQIVWNDTSLQPGAAGGGGTSQLFKRPSYQKGTVTKNRRFLPDVSMLADIAPGYTVFCSATPDCVNSESTNPWQTVGGTSAATPLLAGGLALVDESQRLNGRHDVGFVNPLLYKIGRNGALRGSVFSDVQEFSNDIGPFITRNHRSLGCCKAGPGFDRASGWGSVNLTGLAAGCVRADPPSRRPVAAASSASRQARGSVRDLVVLGGLPGWRVRRRPDRPRKGVQDLLGDRRAGGSRQDHGPDGLWQQAPEQDALGVTSPPGHRDRGLRAAVRRHRDARRRAHRVQDAAHSRLSCRFPSGLGPRPRA